MTSNKVQIADGPANLVMYGNGLQIANGGIIDLFFIDTGCNVKLSTFRLDLSCYNLFVVDERLESNGEFSVSIENELRNSKGLIPGGKLNEDALNKILFYPSLICNRNKDYHTAGEDQNARVCRVHAFEVVPSGIKFRYITSKVFSQRYINENCSLLGIRSSDQSNELDQLGWEIKDINLVSVLGLDGEYYG